MTGEFHMLGTERYKCETLSKRQRRGICSVWASLDGDEGLQAGRGPLYPHPDSQVPTHLALPCAVFNPGSLALTTVGRPHPSQWLHSGYSLPDLLLSLEYKLEFQLLKTYNRKRQLLTPPWGLTSAKVGCDMAPLHAGRNWISPWFWPPRGSPGHVVTCSPRQDLPVARVPPRLWSAGVWSLTRVRLGLDSVSGGSGEAEVSISWATEPRMGDEWWGKAPWKDTQFIRVCIR